MIEALESVHDHRMTRQQRAPWPVAALVAQVLPGGRAIRDHRLAPDAIRDGDEHPGRHVARETQILDRVSFVRRQRRRPHEARRSVAEEVEDLRRTQLIDVRQIGEARLVAEAIAALINPVAYLSATDVDDVGCSAAVQIGEPQAGGIHLAEALDEGSTLHHYTCTEPAHAKMRPILDSTIVHAYHVRETVTRHVREERVESRVLG